MNEPRVVESVTNECQSLGRAHESSSARAEQLIACLEGEIAKRDARIAELESKYQRDVYGLNNEGDPIGGDPAGGYANDNLRLRAELAAIKAQEPVGVIEYFEGQACVVGIDPEFSRLPEGTKLYAAPVPEAKAQGLVMPDQDRYFEIVSGVFCIDLGQELAMKLALVTGAIHNEIISLNAATAAPAADTGDVLDQAMYTLISIGYHENSGLVHELRQALAAHRAKWVV